MGKVRVQPVARLRNIAGVRLQIAYLRTDTLEVGANQTRKHSRQQIRQIADSINTFGFVAPITVYGGKIVSNGVGRLEAARLLGLEEVPVVYLEHLTHEQARLLALADNKLAEGSSWDLDALRREFFEIERSAPEIDLGTSGFTIGERDVLIGRHRVDELADLDEVPPPETKAISVLGGRWRLGRHDLMCGSATDPEVIAALLGGRKIRTVVSDLPYNVPIKNNVSGNGRIKHDDFVMATGEMSPAQFTQFLGDAIAAAQPHMIDGALLYLFQDWRHLAELTAAAERRDLAYLNLLVWAKGKGGQGALYRSAHELIGVFRHGKAQHRNNIMSGKYGRNRTNVLQYPGMSSFGRGRNKALELHPTVKPVAMIADLILDASGPGEIVLDSFGGSGTTLIAAEKTDRSACLVELDPIYVDVTIRRFEAATGEKAIHADSGETFAQVAARRASEGEK